MTLLDELQEKLSEAQIQVQKATTELNEFAEIKGSLRSADQQVTAAASKLEELSGLLGSGATALEKAATNLSETNEIIRKTDPAKALKELGAISSRQKSAEKKLKASIQDLGQETNQALNGLRENNQSIVTAGIEQLEK